MAEVKFSHREGPYIVYQARSVLKGLVRIGQITDRILAMEETIRDEYPDVIFHDQAQVWPVGEGFMEVYVWGRVLSPIEREP